MPLSPKARAVIDAYTPSQDREYYYRLAAKEGASGKVSSTGARGLFQFTGGTGRAYGLVGKHGDIRDDDKANTLAAVKLTEDNRAILRRHLGRDPNYSELALAHQQGADTAGKMLTGTGNAPPRNLAVNNVDPNASPQAAAEKIMNYYGFNQPPGMTLNSTSPMFDPNRPGAFATGPAGAVPYVGAFTPPAGGTSLTSAPADVAVASGQAPASFADRLLGGANATGEASKNTPFANTFAGLGDIQKGISPKASPTDLNTIAPSTLSASVGQQQASSQPLAQGILTQMIQAMQQRRGVR
jgi:hypothetical protein